MPNQNPKCPPSAPPGALRFCLPLCLRVSVSAAIQRILEGEGVRVRLNANCLKVARRGEIVPIERAMHIHPTVSELIPTMLEAMEPLS